MKEYFKQIQEKSDELGILLEENNIERQISDLNAYDRWAQSILISTPGGIKPSPEFLKAWYEDTDYQDEEK